LPFLHDVPHHGENKFCRNTKGGQEREAGEPHALYKLGGQAFTMYAISVFFLGFLFRGLIGPEAVDYVKMPLGLG